MENEKISMRPTVTITFYHLRVGEMFLYLHDPLPIDQWYSLLELLHYYRMSLFRDPLQDFVNRVRDLIQPFGHVRMNGPMECVESPSIFLCFDKENIPLIDEDVMERIMANV